MVWSLKIPLKGATNAWLRVYRNATKPLPSFAAAPLNNAVLLSYTVYHRTTPQHRELLRGLGGDLRAFVALCKHAVEDKPDPLAYLDYMRARTK